MTAPAVIRPNRYDFLLSGGDSARPRPKETTSLNQEEERQFQSWAQARGLRDVDDTTLTKYDYRGAFKNKIEPDAMGHWPDTFKRHGHPLFSNESQYSTGRGDGGTWVGEKLVPPPSGTRQNRYDYLLTSAPNVAPPESATVAPPVAPVSQAVPPVPPRYLNTAAIPRSPQERAAASDYRALPEEPSTLNIMGRQAAGVARGVGEAFTSGQVRDVGGAIAKRILTHPEDIPISAAKGLKTAGGYVTREIEEAAGRDMSQSSIPPISGTEAALGALDYFTMGPLTASVAKGGVKLARGALARRAVAIPEGARGAAITSAPAAADVQAAFAQRAARAAAVEAEQPSPTSQAIRRFEEERAAASRLQDRVEVIPPKPSPKGDPRPLREILREQGPRAEVPRMDVRDRVFYENPLTPPRTEPSGISQSLRSFEDRVVEGNRVANMTAEQRAAYERLTRTPDLARPALKVEQPERTSTPRRRRPVAGQGKVYDVGGVVAEAFKSPAAKTALTATVGAGLGAGADKEHPVRGAAIGAAGALGARALLRNLTAPSAAVRSAATAAVARGADEARVVGSPNAIQRVMQPVAPYAKTAIVEARTPDELLEHSYKLLRDANGQDEIRALMQEQVASGKVPTGGRISHDEARAAADALGMSVESLATKNPSRALAGPELLALKDVMLRDIGRRKLVRDILADQGRPEAERATATTLKNALEDRLIVQHARLARDVSQKGRDLELMKMVAQTSDDPADWVFRAQRLAGGQPLSSALEAEIWNAAARKDFAAASRAIGKARVVSAWDQAAELKQSFLLSAFSRPLRDVFSNLVNLGDQVVVNRVATTFDQLASVFTGRRAFDAPARAMTAAAVRGLKEGARKAGAIITGKSDDTELLQRVMQRYDLTRESSQSNPLLRAFTTVVRRSLAAPDQLVYTAAETMGLEEQARLFARHAAGAAKGPAYEKAFRAFAEKPSPAMQFTAGEEALKVVWQHKTVLGDAAATMGLRRAKQPALRFLGVNVMPFTQTPGAMGTQTLASTPLGLLATPTDLMHLVRKTEMEPAQRRLVQKLARVTVGGGWMAAGYFLASKGKMSGFYPSNANDANQWKEQGVLENAVKIGKTWAPLTGVIGPQAQLLSIGAVMYHLMKDDGQSAVAATAVGSSVGAASTLLSTPMMEGPKTMVDALTTLKRSPEEFGEALAKVGESQIGGWVPQALQRIARARDVDAAGQIVMRETRGDNAGAGMVNAVKQGVPGLRETLPKRVTPLGRLRTSGKGGPLSVISPFRTSADASADPVVAELARLHIGIGDRTPRPGESRRDLAARQTTEGPEVKKRLADYMSSASYERAKSDSVRVAYLKAIIARTRTAQTKTQTKRTKLRVPKN